MSGLRVAVPKGAIFEDALAALGAAGLPARVLRENGRRLFYREGDTEFIVSRPSDVPVFVEHGAADVGIVGKDVLEEQLQRDGAQGPGHGACRMILAAPEGRAEEVRWAIRHAEVVRVATKFPNTARRYFERLGRQAEVIELHGSVELAPLVGLAECIVDLTATGTTLRENDLVVLDEISTSTARLIANRGSYRLRHREISALAEAMRGSRLANTLDARETEAGEVVGRLRRPGGFLSEEIRDAAREIVEDVRDGGDEALLEYTERFDGARPRQIRFPGEEIERARSPLGRTRESLRGGNRERPGLPRAGDGPLVGTEPRRSDDGTAGAAAAPGRGLRPRRARGLPEYAGHGRGSGPGGRGGRDLRLHPAGPGRTARPEGACRRRPARAGGGLRRRRRAGGRGHGLRHAEHRRRSTRSSAPATTT